MPDRRVQRDIGVYGRSPACQQRVRSRTKEHFDRAQASFDAARVERGSAVCHTAIDILAAFDQRLHNVLMAVMRARVKGCLAVVVRRIEVCPSLSKELTDVRVSSLGTDMQRSPDTQRLHARWRRGGCLRGTTCFFCFLALRISACGLFRYLLTVKLLPGLVSTAAAVAQQLQNQTPNTFHCCARRPTLQPTCTS